MQQLDEIVLFFPNVVFILLKEELPNADCNLHALKKNLLSLLHRWGQLILGAISSKCQQKFGFIFHSWKIQSHLFVSRLDIC